MKTISSLIAFLFTSIAITSHAGQASGKVSQAPNNDMGLVMQKTVSLKAAPKDSARELAVLWQGEWVEVRDKRINYLEVYDHKRERAGYVKVSHLRESKFHQSETGEFLTLVRYLRDQRGSNSLGISLASAYLKAATPEQMNAQEGAEVLAAIGVFADRIASLASSNQTLSKPQNRYLTQQLEVASQYGVHFNQIDVNGQIRLCYDGETYRQVLALPADDITKAKAALSLTENACIHPDLSPVERAQIDVWRADVLSKVNSEHLPEFLKNRIAMRKASILSSLSYARTRFSENKHALSLSGITGTSNDLMLKAMQAFSQVDKSQLPDTDWPVYNNTAMLVNANRWALKTPVSSKQFGQLKLEMREGKAGETCVSLHAKNQKAPLVERCTYSVVWPQSATINQKKNAIALAVQPMPGWRELWVFKKQKTDWTLAILPPNLHEAGLGYAEFAGWSPNGKQILLAKESRTPQGNYHRRYEVVNLATLTVQRQARDVSILGAFQRWQDPIWLANSISIR